MSIELLVILIRLPFFLYKHFPRFSSAQGTRIKTIGVVDRKCRSRELQNESDVYLGGSPRYITYTVSDESFIIPAILPDRLELD